MNPPANDPAWESELENFREQWRADLARSKNPAASGSQVQPQQDQVNSSSSATVPRKSEPWHRKPASKPVEHLDDEEDYVVSRTFVEPGPSNLSDRTGPQEEHIEVEGKEPQTALEFYEKAVDRETTGKLGDSVQLYRKAFRMDDRVDQAYKQKHFPGRWKPAQVNPANAPLTVPNTAHHSLKGPQEKLSLSDLIASFAGLTIQGKPPPVEGMPAPPSPMSELPEEILIHILRDVAVLDVGDFVRLSQVCKKFAYLVATEDRIWRRVCLGFEFGFAAMAYHWQREITWEELDPEQELDEDLYTMEQLQQRRDDESEAVTNSLFHSLYSGSWQKMFRQRPRIRFNGVYISTVNYIRSGQASVHQTTWNSPVHIVTYYRYLRFYRDGTVISLLTTDEPGHVVHHLTKENVHHHRENFTPHIPSAIMKAALKGRWRLSALDNPDADISEVEGDLYIETEGIGPKYIYRKDLTLKTAGKAVKNKKITWKGFWSYNRLTDDWGEFALKNDKAFYFSRVKSYGVQGE